MIPKETVDRIFDLARIEEVVGEFVSLKKRGASMIGLCPFHNEKTPSFNVSPTRGIYKCFGCGKGGNSVNFIMEHEHLSYPESLRWLAKKYNVTIEEAEESPEQRAKDNERESLLLVSAFAQKHFTKNLHETEEGKAIGLTYFKERGFRNDIIEKFQLGYSPDTWRDLSDAALAAGYKLEYLVKAGLTIQKEEDPEKFFDRFKGRVIFPVHNASGRVIAFGGRTLKTDKTIAKYINSPETDIYHKSNVLYGLYFAKKRIIEEDVCYLVEGYTDVTSMHQAGIENVVASSGTSLTVEQIRLIRRYTNNITILYDGDPAGIKASFRGIDLILEEGMNVRVLLFPDNDDPDSYSKKVSSEELKEFIRKNTKDFIRFKTELLSKDVANDPIKKSGLIHDIVESIALIPDAITRSVFVKDCSIILQIEEQTLLNELNKQRRKNYDKKTGATGNQEYKQQFTPDITARPSEVVPVEQTSGTEYTEREVIRLMLNYGSCLVLVDSETEEGKTEQIEISLAEYLLAELELNHITFQHTMYARMLDVYRAIIAKGSVPDLNYFITHEEKEISMLAIDLVSIPYQLSNWEQHGIFVQGENLVLTRAASHAANALKLKNVEMMINEKRKNIRELEEKQEFENMLIELGELKALEDAKKHFSAVLGRVVIR
ncbi:MAG TPA: DNA primase [Bacteroidia bacterium]|jgi:DNA primase|nr:DNA primase [Bacteroidia bacterium]